MAFTHDVFLSYSSKDAQAVRDLAQRLRDRGLRVWFDEWEVSLGDSIPARIEAGLEGSGVLVLCMSANAFGSEWTQLESQTFRFRDPLNRERRFIPLRLDGAPAPGSLAQFRYADWRERADLVIDQLARMCRPADERASMKRPRATGTAPWTVSLGHVANLTAVAYSPDGTCVITGSRDRTARIRDLRTGVDTVLEGHTEWVTAVALSPDGTHALTGSLDGTARIWDLSTGTHITLQSHTDGVLAVAYAPNGTHALSGSADGMARIWDLSAGSQTVLVGHSNLVTAVAYSPDGTHVLTGSADGTARIWDLSVGSHTVLEGHTNDVTSVAYSPDGTHAMTGSLDATARIWDLGAGTHSILRGHTDAVLAVAYHPDGTHAMTGSRDRTARIWDLSAGSDITLRNYGGSVLTVAFSPDGTHVMTGSLDGAAHIFDLSTDTYSTVQGHTDDISAVAFSPDGTHVITGSLDKTAHIWDLGAGTQTVLEGHPHWVTAVAFSPDGTHVISGSAASLGTARIWDLGAGTQTVLEGHPHDVTAVTYAPDGTHVLTGSYDGTVRVWDVTTGTHSVLEGHTREVTAVAYSRDGTHALTGSVDGTARVWDLDTGTHSVLEGHTKRVTAVAYGPDGTHVLTGSSDGTARVWGLTTGTHSVLEGHTHGVTAVAYSPDGTHAVTGSHDGTARIWNLTTGTSTVLEGHKRRIVGVAWLPDGTNVCTVASNGVLRLWSSEGQVADDSVRYTNAKVLLVGESQAGKSGLAIRLATGRWRTTDTTIGAWATQMQLPTDGASPAEEHREVWLWDFGGQADQQLIHQLYMHDAAVAVLVFDAQRRDAVPLLWHWTHALDASAREVPRLFVSARVDAFPVRIPGADLATIREEARYRTYLSTSAKTGRGCDELREAIVDSIDWSAIPWRSTPTIFQELREAILALRDKGRVLISVKDLRDLLALDVRPFTDDQLSAVIGLLASPGAVMTLGFGDWVLLRPEVLNTYAQAVIYTLRSDPEERGSVSEERVLAGDLDYPPDFAHLPEADEAIVLLAMHKQLVERELCFRDHDEGNGRAAQLIFPSYFRRDRPDRPMAPHAMVSYRFRGMIDIVYASLVTRLYRSDTFDSGALWRNAADFVGPGGVSIGIRLSVHDGEGQIDVYYDDRLPTAGEQVLFDRHVDEHLRRTASDVQRLRIYRCPTCHTAMDKDVTQRRIANGKTFIRCNACDAEPTIPFHDELERRFTDDETQTTVARERDVAQVKLDNESRERQLVGEVVTLVASAGQIAREVLVSDRGLDMEVEFKDDHGRATGTRIWLQLKSGDSHLRHRKRDGARLFRLTKRHATYWADQSDPVYLVVRGSDGRIEAMDIRAELLRLRPTPAWPPREVQFVGERFDVMCVRRWRQQVLGLSHP